MLNRLESDEIEEQLKQNNETECGKSDEQEEQEEQESPALKMLKFSGNIL